MHMFHRAWCYGYATPCDSRSFEQRCEGARARLPQAALSWHSGPMFGMRRPIRQLAWKLELSDAQTRDLVEILDRLKTAYGQAKLDRDRSVSDIAAVFGGAVFEASHIDAALDSRVTATRTLNGELTAALKRIYELLTESQRREFAYLLRSGGFTL